MDVFDSNVWIYGLTQTCEEAVALVDEAIENAYHVGVDAYIFDEVMRNLERSEQPQEAIDRAQTRFAEIIHGNHTIHGPSQEEITQMDIEAVRRDPKVDTMAEVLGIQTKDVPILVFAHQLVQDQDAPTTVIHTTDHSFSRFDPSAHFEKIAMHYVDCSP